MRPFVSLSLLPAGSGAGVGVGDPSRSSLLFQTPDLDLILSDNTAQEPPLLPTYWSHHCSFLPVSQSPVPSLPSSTPALSQASAATLRLQHPATPAPGRQPVPAPPHLRPGHYPRPYAISTSPPSCRTTFYLSTPLPPGPQLLQLLDPQRSPGPLSPYTPQPFIMSKAPSLLLCQHLDSSKSSSV